MNRQIKGQSLCYISVTILTGILFAILISLTPPGADDLLFLIPAKGHEPGLGLWDMMIGELPRIWQTQSGRLGNFIAMPILYLMPKWIFGVITGFLTSLLIILSARISGSRPGSIVSWLLYATIVIAYPWYDYLTLVTYAINYIWTSAVVAGTMVCFMNINRYSRAGMISAFILAFIAGWMHEGFGAPLCVGLTLAIVVNLKNIGRRQLLLYFFTGIGTCMTFLSPVFWSRSERETNFLLKFTYKEALMQLGPAMLFVFVLIALTIMVMIRKDLRKRIWTSMRFLLFAGAAAASTAVFLKYYTGPRTGAPAMLYSALGCAYVITTITKDKRPAQWLSWVVACLIGGFGLIHLAYADVAQAECKKEYEEVTRLYEQSTDGTFYYDLSYPTADLSLFKTSVRQFHERIPKDFMRIYFKPDHSMVILPTAMKGFAPDKAVESRLTPGVLLYNGWIVLPDSIDTGSFQRIHILTETGEYLPSRFRIDRFKSDTGSDFIIVTPHIKVLDPSLRVKDVAMQDHSR